MLLIPIGHDHGELARWPVITLAIMAICGMVAFAQYDTERGKPRPSRTAMQDALAFYVQNPDLTPSPKLSEAFDRALAQEDAGERWQVREGMKRFEGDAETRPERQQKLDELTNAWTTQMTDNMVWRWGLIPAEFSWLKLLTSMFVHSGFLHLLFNMLFLYMTGPFIEDVWGRPFFLAFYLAGGMFADGMFAWQHADLTIPLVGASGAVSAVMGAFLIRYPRAKIRLMTFLLWRRIVFSAPAWLLFSLWFLGEYAAARATPSYTPLGGPAIQVANWAHVWGFLFGASVCAAIRFFKIEDRYFFEAIERQREHEADPLRFRVERELKKGGNAAACRLLAAELRANPNDAEIAETYWELSRGGPMMTQPAVCLSIIESDLRQRRETLALDRWLELHHQVPAAVPEIRLAIPLAECLSKHGHEKLADELLVECYHRLQPSSPPQLWVELAQYCVSAGSSIAGEIVARALANPRLPAEARAELERGPRRLRLPSSAA